MAEEIVFYQLNAKILEREQDVPPDAQQVVYYALALGHHIGVFDCFKPMLRCSQDFIDRLAAALPEGEARRKFENIRRFGEITIDKSHTRLLGEAFDAARPRLDAEQAAWCDTLCLSLAAIDAEPAIYIMARRR